MATHLERMAASNFDSELDSNSTNALRALAQLNNTGTRAAQQLLRILKRPSKFPNSAEQDIRVLIAEIKTQRDANITKWIDIVESADSTNFQAIADANGINIG